MSIKIQSIHAREILDSRGLPTVETEVVLSCGTIGVASVPSGASTGSYEAHEKRDNDKNRYFGKGVLDAVNSVNKEIASCLIGEDPFRQRYIDKRLIELDSSENKSRLGANAILSVSLAVAKASANCKKLPLYRYLGGIYASKLPIPMMNILNGGAHASNNLDIQEFMIVPCGFDSFKDALRAGCEIYNSLKKILAKRGLGTSVGDEGGFAPDLKSENEAIELIIEAIESAHYDTKRVKLALDIASSEWRDGAVYSLPKSRESFTSVELIEKWSELCKKYPIISIEDPLSEQDFEGWSHITSELNNIMLVGDDLFVTNQKRLKMGIDKKIANSILIKPNQIGTLTESLDAIFLARSKGYSSIVSHRSGETDDSYIADICVATSSGFIKTGAPCRMDRCAKYNRLSWIEDDIYSNS